MRDEDPTAVPDDALLLEVVEAFPEGLVVFDADWTICHVNPRGAHLLGGTREEMSGRSIWVALPELGGTIFHSFLLHARSVGEQVTWHGYYAPTRRWLAATAVRRGARLHMTFRAVSEGAITDGSADGGALRHEPAEPVDQDRLRLLAEASEAMISTLDTGESVSTLAHLVVPRLCDWAVVTVVGDDGRPVDGGRAHRDPARLADLDTYLDGRVPAPDGESNPMAAALLTGEPVHVNAIDPVLVEPSLGSAEVRNAWQRLDAVSFTIVPLRARGETFGVLGMVNTSVRPPQTELEIATAVEIARRASLAIDNARLYGRQLKVAETLQRSLLTPPPQPDQLELAVRYQPAATHMHVGGDWYDAFQQPDGATLLVIGDVVGHNVDAAAAMGQIRSILRGIAYDRPEAPARILSRVDRVLSGLRFGTMATALVARLEQTPEQAARGLRTVRWSSAGHLPPVVLRADGTVELLDATAEILLGADSGRTRSDHEATLVPGDTLLLYTDGLVEHGRTAIDDGLERLLRLVREFAGATVDDLCDALIDRIVRSRSDDDVALVAVRCHPETPAQAPDRAVAAGLPVPTADDAPGAGAPRPRGPAAAADASMSTGGIPGAGTPSAPDQAARA